MKISKKKKKIFKKTIKKKYRGGAITYDQLRLLNDLYYSNSNEFIRLVNSLNRDDRIKAIREFRFQKVIHEKIKELHDIKEKQEGKRSIRPEIRLKKDGTPDMRYSSNHTSFDKAGPSNITGMNISFMDSLIRNAAASRAAASQAAASQAAASQAAASQAAASAALNVIYTKHAYEQMVSERDISPDIVERIIRTQPYKIIHDAEDPRPRREYIERGEKATDIIKIITNHDPADPYNITVITAIRHEPPSDDKFTHTALQTMKDKQLDQARILDIVKHVRPIPFGDKLRFRYDGLSILTNMKKDLVISIRVERLTFTANAEESMKQNLISHASITRILSTYKPHNAGISEDPSRLEFIDEENDIRVYTNKDQDVVIGIFYTPPPDSLRSTISQPLLTHRINWETEGCALQRTYVDVNWGIDCIRCGMSYAGIGIPSTRSKLQNTCIKYEGLYDSQIDDWLKQNARKPYGIKNAEWNNLYPRVYWLNNNFIKKHNKTIGQLAEMVADKLLGSGEQVVVGWKLVDSERWESGHTFNLAKLPRRQGIWYVDAQQFVNPGDMTFVQKEKELLEQESRIWQFTFILTPHQAEQLVDDQGQAMLYRDPEFSRRARGIRKSRKKPKRKHKKNTKRK